ncbi:hypothetical protein ACIA8K_06915 [Catenuloplanes sp. NPDC051500]|uniref:hypothetical protein n=1 Tax=Catenuloplanes sp. NPDC051500 TaxID=3363959 RepID=UPI00379F7823
MADSPSLRIRINGDIATIRRLVAVLREVDPLLDADETTRRDGKPAVYVQMRMPNQPGGTA